MSKPILNERFADNGEHSHWELITSAGEVLWSDEDSVKFPKMKVIFQEGVQVSDENLEGCVATILELGVVVSGEDKLDSFRETIMSIAVLLAHNSGITSEQLKTILPNPVRRKRELSEMTDTECLEIARLFGNMVHLSEESQIHQNRELLCTYRFYNKQTNIPGNKWVRVAAYLFQQGFKIEGI